MTAAQAKYAVALVCVVLAALLAAPTAHALYEDQVGLMEWYQSNIGPVQQIAFHPNMQARAIYAASNFSFSSINAKHGQLNWRQNLPLQHQVQTLLYSPKVIATCTNACSLVRAWNPIDGGLFWEHSISISASNAAYSLRLIADVDGDNIEDVLVMAQNQVYLFSGASGKTNWHITLTSASSAWQALQIAVGKDVTYVLLSSTPGSFAVRSIALSTGSVRATDKFSLPQAVSIDQVTLLSAGFVITADVKASVLISYSIVDRKSINIPFTDIFSATTLASLSESSSLTISPLQYASSSSSAVHHTGVAAALFALTVSSSSSSSSNSFSCNGYSVSLSTTPSQFILKAEDAGVKLLVSVTNTHAVVSAGIDLNGNVHVGSLSINEKGELASTIHQITRVGSVVVPLASSGFSVCQHGGLEKAWLEVFRKGGSKDNSFRWLISAADHSLHFIQEGKELWSREESLSLIDQVDWYKIPAPPMSTKTEEFPSFIPRLMLQAVQAKETLQEIAQQTIVLVQAAARKYGGMPVNEESSSASVSTPSLLTPHRYGYRQIIVALTQSFKVYGLHSETGRPVWSLWLPIQGSASEWTLKLHFVRSPHILSHSPRAVVLARSANQQLLFVFNQFTGVLETIQKLDYLVDESYVLSAFDQHHQHILLLVDTDLTAHVYPDNEFNRAAARSHASQWHFSRVDFESNSVVGYSFRPIENRVAQAFSSWKLPFSKSTETITAFARHASNEHVHSSIRVAGSDNSVTHKYLNPHLLAVATVFTPSDESPVTTRAPEPSVVIYLIDSVRGAVLHRVVQQSAQAPVKIVVSENNVFAHYFNAKLAQNEVTVIELSAPSDFSPSYLDVFRGTEPGNFSSWDASRPALQQQSYLFKGSVQTIGVTNTQQGITNRQLIFGLSSGQLLAIDRAWLDPRRHPNPTNEEKEDGLIPYRPDLPFATTDMITHRYQVAHLRDISTASATLESASLVFAYGCDMYYIRVTPSASFDVLNEDFLYAGILLSVVGMLALIITLKRQHAQQLLAEQWK